MHIRWTKNANQNLEQVEAYIAHDNHSAAIEVVLKIINAVERLAEHPAMGRHGRVVGTRELIVAGTPFIIPYRVKGQYIEILRVLHGAMKWPKDF